MTTALLLSGGLDSSSLVTRVRPDIAIGFRYGQPAADAEITAAQTIAARRGVPFVSLLLPELRLDPMPGRSAAGVSRAFVPGRNALFLTRAAAACARTGERLVLVMGCNADDFAAFPDCRPAFFDAARSMLRASLVGVCDVWIETPWIETSKAGILAACADNPETLEDICESISCYRGTRCGTCDACTLRARAFAQCGLVDGSRLPVTHGGDPHRDAALKGS